MKKLFVIALLVMSANAYAGMWVLVHQEYSPGTGHICTYQLQGTNYTSTIISQSFCQPSIFQ